MDDIFKEIILNKTPGYVLIAVGILGALYGLLKLYRLGQDVVKTQADLNSANDIKKIIKRNLKEREEVYFLKRTQKDIKKNIEIVKELHEEMKEEYGADTIWPDTKGYTAFNKIEAGLIKTRESITSAIDSLKDEIAITNFSLSKIKSFSTAVVIVSFSLLFTGVISLQTESTITDIQSNSKANIASLERMTEQKISDLKEKLVKKDQEILKLGGKLNQEENDNILKGVDQRLLDTIIPLSSVKDAKVVLRDHSAADDDNITLTINGTIVANNVTLKNISQEFSIELRAGKNVIEIMANNVGESPPNTAEVLVFSGNALHIRQEYSLGKSEKAGFIINVE